MGFRISHLSFCTQARPVVGRQSRKKLPDEISNVSGKQSFEFANIQGDSGLEFFYGFTVAGKRYSGAFEYEASGGLKELDAKWKPPLTW